MSTYFKDEASETDSTSQGLFGKLSLYYQAISDKLQFYKRERWVVVGVVGVFYIIRIFITKGKFSDSFIRISCSNLLSRNTSLKRFYRIHFST